MWLCRIFNKATYIILYAIPKTLFGEIKKYFFLLLLILQSCSVSKKINSEEIFRHVNLGSHGQIKLGNTIENYHSLIDKKNNQYILKENVFGRVKKIELIPDKKGKVNAIIFQYKSKKNKFERKN